MKHLPSLISLASVIWVLPSAAATPASAPVTTLPTMVVTGSTPVESLPLSVSILEVPAAQTTVIRETSDLSARVPNFFVADSSLRSFGQIYSIRGSANTVFFSNPAVGIYVDDVPLGDTYSMLTPLYDVSNVEVFRGPQPERFGLNGEAGILSIHTRVPGDAWHGSASGSYGSYETQDHRLSLSGPLIQDQLSLSLSGVWSSSEGFLRNSTLNHKTDDRQMYGGRGVLYWTPGQGWEISVGFEGTQVNDGTQRFSKLGGDHFKVASDVPGDLNMHQHREWLKIGKEFDSFKVTSITSHGEWELDPFELDLDLSPATTSLAGVFPGVLPFASGARSDIRREQETWSQEIRFESLPPKQPAPMGKDSKKVVVPVEDVWRWNAGLFFQDKQTLGDDLRSFSVPFVIPPGPFGAFTVYTPFKQRTVYSYNEETMAGYANGTYTTGPWELSAGVRVDYTRKTLDRVKTDAFTRTPVSGEYTEWTVAPAAGILYHINPNAELFARTSLGFKPGGFSAYEDNPSLARYDRETVWATELGLRAQALDGRLRGNLTAYYNHYDDYQVERIFGATNFLVVNADEAVSYGLELEVNWEMLHGLTFSGSVGLNRTELTNYRDPVTGANLSGNEAPSIPNLTARVGLDYAMDCGFRASVEYVAVGDTYFTDSNISRYSQNAYGLLNARVGFERDWYGIYLFGRNLADKEYYTYTDSFLDAGVVGEPRILGVMAMLKF